MAHFHPDSALLMDYAAGTLPEGPSLIMATHAALCPACRSEVARLEALGGALLECSCGTMPVSSRCRDKVMALLDAPETPAPEPLEQLLCRILPEPLRRYVGCGLGDIQWEPVTDKVDQVCLPGCREGQARLIRVRTGTPFPDHTHAETEYTLVLQGNFRDNAGLYRRGDLLVCPTGTHHAPVAGDTEDCICLLVAETPAKPAGLLGRLRHLFVRP